MRSYELDREFSFTANCSYLFSHCLLKKRPGYGQPIGARIGTEKRGVNERLVAYWDQVWTLLYTPEEQLVWKSEEKAGAQEDSFVHVVHKHMCMFI